MNPVVERHQASISNTLSCFDRVVLTGTLPDICHPRAMAGFLDYHKICLFDFPRKTEKRDREKGQGPGSVRGRGQGPMPST